MTSKNKLSTFLVLFAKKKKKKKKSTTYGKGYWVSNIMTHDDDDDELYSCVDVLVHTILQKNIFWTHKLA